MWSGLPSKATGSFHGPRSTFTPNYVKQAVRETATIYPAPCKLTLDVLTLKVVSELRATWATSVPILVFPDLSVIGLGPMYVTDRRQTDVRRQTRIIA